LRNFFKQTQAMFLSLLLIIIVMGSGALSIDLWLTPRT
jgi:hypothetical protein